MTKTMLKNKNWKNDDYVVDTYHATKLSDNEKDILDSIMKKERNGVIKFKYGYLKNEGLKN